MFTPSSIRQALKQLNNLEQLSQHPLATLQLVVDRLHHEQPTPTLRGRALRQLLLETIASFQPAPTPPDFAARAWRPYLILQEQFVQKRRANALRDRLVLSESAYFAEQKQALERLGHALATAEAAVLAQRTAVASPQWPLFASPFIGRHAELGHLLDQLQQPTCRFLTLLGPGGMGKTRLAVQLAHTWPATSPLGRVFVPLADVPTAEAVPAALAHAFAITARTAETPRQQVLNYLRDKRLLLIVDNCEHLLTSRTFWSDLLQSAPHIKILATSRERFNMPEEWVMPLLGLPVPAASATAAEWAEADAVQLFLHTAQRQQLHAPPPTAEHPHIARICRLVDGSPLGIELAASWAHLLSAAEIAAEIERDLDFLQATAAPIPPRHQSIRAIFNSAWRRLATTEQVAFARLTTLHGPFTREMAAEIAGTTLPTLQALVRQSFLSAQWGTYHIHPLLRHYGAQQLAADVALAQATHHAHGRYFLAGLPRHTAALHGGNQREALQAIHDHLENIRAAWAWALAHHQPDLVTAAQEPLFLFFAMSFRFADGGTWFQAAAAPDQPPVIRAFALGAIGRFYASATRWADSHAAFAEALALLPAAHPTRLWVSLWAIATDAASAELYAQCVAHYTAVGDVWGQATAHFQRATYFLFTQPTAATPTAVRQLLEQSAAHYHTLADRWGLANTAHLLGQMAFDAGDYALAQRHLHHSLAIRYELEDYVGAIFTGELLFRMATAVGDLETADRYCAQEADMVAQSHNPFFHIGHANRVGYLALARGDWPTAEQAYQQSLRVAQTVDNAHSLAWAYYNLGELAYEQGAWETAAHFYEQSVALHQTDERDLWGLSVALEKLGRVQMVQGAWAQGQAQVEQALRWAVQGNLAVEELSARLTLAQLQMARGESTAAHAALAELATHPALTAPLRRRLAAVWGQDRVA